MRMVVQLLQRIRTNNWNRSVMTSEFLRFNAFGIVNSAFAWVVYEILYRIDVWPGHAAVSAWAISCTLGMIQSHYVHYTYTFHNAFPYEQSLYRAIMVYSGQLMVTTYITYLMVEQYLIHHRIIWLLNTCLFGLLNFLMIRWIAFPPEHDVKRLRA